jgi:hypothetical protein
MWQVLRLAEAGTVHLETCVLQTFVGIRENPKLRLNLDIVLILSILALKSAYDNCFLSIVGKSSTYYYLSHLFACASTIFISLALQYFSTIQKTLGPAFIYKHAQQFSASPTGPASGSAPSSSGSVSFRMSILLRNCCLYDGSQISVPFKDKAL